MKETLILGGAGSGKTTRLLNIMESHIAAGVPAGRIAFVSFTRAAAGEAKRRAQDRFGLADGDLPHFRTLHSMAFRELGLRRGDVLAEEHLAELAEITGELSSDPRGLDAEDTAASPDRQADALMTVDHYARTTMQTLREAWYDHGGDLDWHRLERFSSAYSLYRLDRGLLDFTDMLSQYVDRGQPADVNVAIIDEAQDLTLLQWATATRAFSTASELWVAGDDLQQIHAWAGAAEDHFLGLDYRREVLPVSHRLPREIFELGERVASHVSRRFARDWTHSGRSGAVRWLAGPEEADLSTGTWLLLARTRAQLSPLAGLARDQGVLYRLKGESSVGHGDVVAIRGYEALRAGRRVDGAEAAAVLRALGQNRPLDEDDRTYGALDLGLDTRPIWHDALVRIPLATREYYLACLRRGERLTSEPRIRIDTIHGSKGAEAENVLLVTDMTWRTWRGYEMRPDDEWKVLYVGCTRASRTLNLVAPRGAYGYPL